MITRHEKFSLPSSRNKHYKKRRARKHRRWRERKAHFGELVQIDGSHHDWFESQGPACVFMGHIDDATGTCMAVFMSTKGPRRTWAA